jgi:NADH:ubiquinone oxidoreductase subunit 6 (subunit J)
MMSEVSEKSDQERMSIRHSLLVWVSGAVLGWVVAVVAIYSILRTSDEPMIAERSNPDQTIIQGTDPERLNNIQPAAGDSQQPE